MTLDPGAVVDDIVATAARSGKTHTVVAFSGGLDSSVLLHILSTQRRIPVRAIHIDHGLQGDQPAWCEHISAFCAAREIILETIALSLTPERGESVEAVAREARYDALAKATGGHELVLLAQHQDDQAETLLLQLLRGSGPAGLAAMAKNSRIAGMTLSRPFLEIPRDALEAYATSSELVWFDDPSNADNRFDRNYLRNSVMPAVAARWPGASGAISRAARLQSEALYILQQQAASDTRLVRVSGSRLSIGKLLVLPRERQANLLRFALSAQGLAPPPSRRLQSILELCANESGRGEVRWGEVSVRRYRDDLFLLSTLPPEAGEDIEFPVSGDGEITLPTGLGRLAITGSACLSNQPLTIRFRRGGERVRESAGQPSRSLAQWFQSRGIPPWERSRTPLLFAGEVLVGIGEFICNGEQPEAQGLRLNWLR